MGSHDTVISLFCGAGGMSLGFSQVGLKPIIAADVDADACHTYSNNLSIEAYNIDLSENNPKFDNAIATIHSPLAIIGGPPCQGFSSAGVKKGDDSRNKLIFHYLSIVTKLRPRWFLFENVEGLLTSHDGKSVIDLVEEFVRIGYRVRLEKVNFAAYGLPQARKRVILMGNCIGVDFVFPVATHSFNAGKHKSNRELPISPTIDDALGGLGSIVAHRDELSPYASLEVMNSYDAIMRKGNNVDGVYLHLASVSKSMAEALSKLQPGQTMKDLPSEFWHSSFERRAFRRVMDGTPTEKRGGAPSGIKRLVGNLNALTITSAATREFIHPYEDRPLTLREAARLQSFPDAYEFSGTAMSIARQIGNAFPPLAAKVFAEHIIKLDGVFGADRCNPTKSGGTLIGYHLTDSSGMSPALIRTDAMLSRIMGTQSSLPLDFFEMKEVA